MSKNNKGIDISEELDTTGLHCPEPLNELKRFGKTVEIGQCFKAITDDPESEDDFKQWAKNSNIEIIDSAQEGSLIYFTFKKKDK
ncbi:MAG: SirA family protein [Promethearchaeota archaeon]|nr:MAG: SirA family protein [Candidatus Lokiarchaeota archaeon]